jgi:hypothetical protein
MRLNSVARICYNSKATLKRRIVVTNANGVGHKNFLAHLLTSKTKFKAINIFQQLTKCTEYFHYYLH